MVAPGALEPEDYPLTGAAGADMFGWPAVLDDRNLRGPLAVAVPGQVAGLALACERFGTWRWADLLAPACALAERGMEVDWHGTLAIAASAPKLAQDPGCAATYLAGRIFPGNAVDGARAPHPLRAACGDPAPARRSGT